MHSSTSNFERPIIGAQWGIVLGVVLGLAILSVAALEMRLGQLGYRATTLDSPELWTKQRARADALGKDALVLIGASRIQLGIDLGQMREDSGMEPVQLAVDGSSFVPVLEDLADDARVTGTVMIDFAPSSVMSAVSHEFGKSPEMVRQFHLDQLHSNLGFSQEDIEQSISQAIREHLRAYADGATPWLSLWRRVLPAQASRQFLVTSPDRSRGANYAIAPMPQTYYNRAIHDVGAAAEIDPADPDAANKIEARIAVLRPYDNADLVKGTAYVSGLLGKLESHGARVILIEMPTTGYIHQIEAKKYPDASFLKVFEALTRRQVFVAGDSTLLGKYQDPDGSHLDMRDRKAFTAELDKELGLTARGLK